MKKQALLFLLAGIVLLGAGCTAFPWQKETEIPLGTIINTEDGKQIQVSEDGIATEILEGDEEATQETTEGEGDVLDVPSEDPENVFVSPEDAPEVPEADRPAALERDKKRVEDIRAILSAAEAYKKDKKSYPEKLDDLAPKYLKEVPKDPTFTGEQGYMYTAIGSEPFLLYDLTYRLEVGFDDFQPGTHIANPPDLVANP
jgi:hypothetical protein